MEMMFIARRFIINLNLAYERSGIGACRRAFPDDEKDLIRNAYEKRIQDTQDETEELRKTSDANFSEHCLPEDASKFLTDYTTFDWNSPVTTEEGDSPLQSTTPNEPLPLSVSTLVRPSESTASDSRWQPSNAEPSTSTRNSVVGRGRSSKGRKPGTFQDLDQYVLEVPRSAKEKPKEYYCTLCGHIASRKHDVRRHATKHDGVVSPIKCFGCNKQFKRTEARQRHWAANPCCRIEDEQISHERDVYVIRHGRKKRGNI